MRLLCAALLALLVAGCGDSGSGSSSTVEAPAATVAATTSAPSATAESATAAAAEPVVAAPACKPGDKRATTDRTATILYVTKATVARKAPKASSAVVVRLQPKSVYGTRQVLLAVGKRVGADCQPTWYRVRLPAKPNGITGWVRARGLVSEKTGTRIQIDLSSRHLDLYRLGQRVLRVPVAIGHIETPTPTGSFYVDVRYNLTDKSGPYGPGLLGVAAYSEAEQGWAAGNPIAIHGTNAPSLIGTRASNGCIRVHNEDIVRIMKLAPTGTPVEIRA
jgi:lipoprotein-anchoring transpeptidase ErfK/SrfK